MLLCIQCIQTILCLCTLFNLRYDVKRNEQHIEYEHIEYVASV